MILVDIFWVYMCVIIMIIDEVMGGGGREKGRGKGSYDVNWVFVYKIFKKFK